MDNPERQNDKQHKPVREGVMKNGQSRETERQTTQNHYPENSNVMYTKSKYIKQTLNKLVKMQYFLK